MTSTLQLTRYDGEDGIEILINSITGESFCSVKGYARMSGRSASTIRERLCNVTETFQGGREQPVKSAEIPTSGGLQGGRLITEDQITEWLPQDNPAAATKLLKLGVRIALHTMAGHSVTTTATAPTPIVADSLEHLRDTASIALALAGSPGVLAIETFKMLNGLATPTIPEPKPTKHTKAIPTPPPALSRAEATDLVQGFMRDVETLLSAGILGPWDVSNITQNFKPCTAIVMQSVIPLLEAHFSYQIDRARLEAAIVNLGGKGSQNQRFEPESLAKRTGRRSSVRKCIVIPAAMI